MVRSLLAAGLFAALLAGAGCRARTPQPGGASGSKPDQARKQAEALAVTAADGAGTAHAKAQLAASERRGGNGLVALAVATGTGMTVTQAAAGDRTPPPPAPKAAPPATRTAAPRSAFRPGSAVVIKERVRSSMPYPNEADADEDALAVAADVIERKLAELDPPVSYRPTPNEVRNEFLRRDARSVRGLSDAERAELEKHKVDTNRVYVEHEVEVTADQVRELRTRDRVSDTLRVLGVLTAGFLAGHLFLLLDARTKGYLTRWLAVGAVTLALAAAAVLYLV
jgi:hypothetical protein